MAREYVEQRDGGYWIAGTRVSLDSIVYPFLRGSRGCFRLCSHPLTLTHSFSGPPRIV